jgi:hypothetical protein
MCQGVLTSMQGAINSSPLVVIVGEHGRSNSRSVWTHRAPANSSIQRELRGAVGGTATWTKVVTESNPMASYVKY